MAYSRSSFRFLVCERGTEGGSLPQASLSLAPAPSAPIATFKVTSGSQDGCCRSSHHVHVPAAMRKKQKWMCLLAETAQTLLRRLPGRPSPLFPTAPTSLAGGPRHEEGRTCGLSAGHPAFPEVWVLVVRTREKGCKGGHGPALTQKKKKRTLQKEKNSKMP